MKNSKIRIWLAIILFLVCFAISYKQSLMPGTDLFVHNHEFASTSNIFQMKLSYPMYHWMILMIRQIGNIVFPGKISVDFAGAFCMGLIEVSIYVLTDKVLIMYGVKQSWLVSFVLCIVTAIWCPFYNLNVYLGQGSPNTWHSPTNMMVKPFTILLFFRVVKLLKKIQSNETINSKEYILLSFLLGLSTLAKPSFYQGFIPALFLYCVVSSFAARFNHIKQYFILGLSIVPATLIIIFKMFSNFYAEAEGIGIGWFLVPKLYSPNVVISLLLLLCFPICYTIFYKDHLKRLEFKLAWYYFIVSYMEYGLLYEKGDRFTHGNFGWAYSLAAYILFTVTTASLFCNYEKESRKSRILTGIWLLHGFSGIAYILILLFIPNIWF